MRYVQKLLISLVAFLIGSTATHANEPISPIDATMAVEANNGKAIEPVTIVMDVQGTGEYRKTAFLNSKLNYRDKASLNIFISSRIRGYYFQTHYP